MLPEKMFVGELRSDGAEYFVPAVFDQSQFSGIRDDADLKDDNYVQLLSQQD